MVSPIRPRQAGRLCRAASLSLLLHGVLCLCLVGPRSFPVKPKATETVAVAFVGIVEEPAPPDPPAEVPAPASPSEPPPSGPPKPTPAPVRPKAEPVTHRHRHRPPVPDHPTPDPATAKAVVTAPPAPAAPTVQPAARVGADSVRDYGEVVWAAIARHKPAGVSARGSAVVAFTLSSDGGLISLSVSRSSGNPGLDRAALAAVRAAAPFPPPPAGIDPADLVFGVPFDYH